MMETRPPRSPGQIVGLVMLTGLIALDGVLAFTLFSNPISILSLLMGILIFISIPAIALVAFLTACLSSARYYVEDMALIVQWGRLRQIIPLDQIHQLTLGQEASGMEGFRGVRWPGHMLGRGRVIVDQGKSLEARFYATRPLSGQIIVVTDSVAYALSPPDLEEFKTSLEAMQQLEGDGRRLEAGSETSFLGWPIWRDRAGQGLLGGAALLNFGLFFYLTVFISDFPAEIVLHFNDQGVADRFGSPSGLLILPLAGLISWLVAVLSGWFFYQVRDERPVAYVVWGATVAIQLAAWVAVIGLLRAS